MTDIFDLTNEYKKREEENWWIISPSDAAFLEEMSAISWIQTSPWYLKIKQYWQLMFQEWLLELNKTDASDIWKIAKIQAKLDLSSSFLYYLSSYEK